MKQAGIRTIAKLANVSIGTVDRALHGRDGVNRATRERVLRVARELAYTPNPAARALSTARAHFRIGVCIPEEIHFFYDQMRMGIFDEARRTAALGIEVLFRPVPSLGQQERRQLTSLLKSGVNALIVTPGNPKVTGPIIDEAESKNIHVICTTTDAPQTSRSGAVCVDPDLSGRLAAELMAKFVPPGSKTAVVTGMLKTEEHRKKAGGFRTGFEEDCDGGEVAAVIEAHESVEEAYRKTCDLLDKCPEIKGIYVSTANSLPVCRALRERELAGEVCVIATDLFEEMVAYLVDGTIRASIYQDPYFQGQLAVRMLADHLINSISIPSTHYLNPAIVLRTNLHLFREVGRKMAAASAKAQSASAPVQQHPAAAVLSR